MNLARKIILLAALAVAAVFVGMIILTAVIMFPNSEN
jgi:hypothetical protein